MKPVYRSRQIFFDSSSNGPGTNDPTPDALRRAIFGSLSRTVTKIWKSHILTAQYSNYHWFTFDKYSAAASSPDLSFEMSTNAFKAAIGSAILCHLEFLFDGLSTNCSLLLSAKSLLRYQYFRISIWPSVKLIVFFYFNRIMSIVDISLYVTVNSWWAWLDCDYNPLKSMEISSIR